jgi:hypothetical protein
LGGPAWIGSDVTLRTRRGDPRLGSGGRAGARARGPRNDEAGPSGILLCLFVTCVVLCWCWCCARSFLSKHKPTIHFSPSPPPSIHLSTLEAKVFGFLVFLVFVGCECGSAPAASSTYDLFNQLVRGRRETVVKYVQRRQRREDVGWAVFFFFSNPRKERKRLEYMTQREEKRKHKDRMLKAKGTKQTIPASEEIPSHLLFAR